MDAALVVRLVAMCVIGCSADSLDGFLQQHSDVSINRLEQTVRATLDMSLPDGSVAFDLAAIEASTWRTFQALPKNKFGRLDPRGVRHLVHAYFTKEHGWDINGLGAHGMTGSITEVHDVNILKDRAPAIVESIMEVRRKGHGLALGDVVAMIGAMEQLIVDEALSFLEGAYKFNGFSIVDELDEAAAKEVLYSYKSLHDMGHTAARSIISENNVAKHQARKRKQSSKYLLDDILNNWAFAHRHEANPFKQRSYSFVHMSRFVLEVLRMSKAWYHEDCSALKKAVMSMDEKDSGRVPLSIFHGSDDKKVSHGSILFAESEEYLREIGALDESDASNIRVLIPNYVAAPSNCKNSFSYYSMCCPNECEGLLNEIEGVVQVPTALPAQLLEVVANLSSPTVDAPRLLHSTLATKLYKIADLNGGMVPLHGRLFSQWLHHTFPNECPYPSVVNDSSVLQRADWETNNRIASKEERERSASSGMPPLVDGNTNVNVSFAHWSDDEILFLDEPSKTTGLLRNALRLVVWLGALCSVKALSMGHQGILSGAKRLGNCPSGQGDALERSYYV